jgi:aubergine-like protein
LIEHIRAYFIVNDKSLPSSIIVYRDGVGAGDIPRLKDTEIAALKVRLNVSTLGRYAIFTIAN